MFFALFGIVLLLFFVNFWLFVIGLVIFSVYFVVKGPKISLIQAGLGVVFALCLSFGLFYLYDNQSVIATQISEKISDNEINQYAKNVVKINTGSIGSGLTNIKQEIISTIYINDQAFEQRAFNQLTFLDGKMVSIQPVSTNQNSDIENTQKNNQTANCVKPNTDGLTIKQLLDLMLDDTICG